MNFFNLVMQWGSEHKYIFAVIVFVAVLLLLWVAKIVLVKQLRFVAKHTKSSFDNEIVAAVEDIPTVFYYFLAAYFPLTIVVKNPDALKWILGIFVVVLVYVSVRFLQNVVLYFVGVFTTDHSGERSGVFHGLAILAKILLWSVALILVLSNLGVDVTSLVASLGIGGVAVALGVQGILGDVFSSFSIYFDKPFQIGDYIVIGTDSGTVKKIGLKTTRLQTLQGEELVISNKELTSCRVQNFKKLKQRRVVMKFGVTYDTSMSKLKNVNSIIEKIFAKVDLVTLDRSHFSTFGDFSLNFEIVYFVNSSEYRDFMDVQQAINFALKEAFEKERIDFAYPTQTVVLQK